MPPDSVNSLPASRASAAGAGTGPSQQWICSVCGWIYDEAKGDVDHGLAPGTTLADIPDDWFCPECGVTKTDFEPFES